MASTDTKCPVCGKTVGIGLVSGLLVQHENKYGERCDGSGGPAAAGTAPRTSSTPRTPSASRAASPSKRGAARPATAPGRAAGVTVRRVEVDPERLARLEEKQRRLREEREEAARRRNEFYSSGVEIGDHSSGADADRDDPDSGDAPRPSDA